MGDMSADAVTYLPASLVRAVVAEPARVVPWYDEVDGTMVMADLSGFTNLSERLGKLGDEGAERLTSTINSFFERMLDTASAYGGDTLTFGGDAILLLFDGEDHAGRAVAASLGMLKQTGRAAAIDAGDGKVKIGMSVGAHSGVFLLAAAGAAEERAQQFVIGRGSEVTALAEAEADRGQLAVSPSTRQLLPRAAKLVRNRDFWRVEDPGGAARAAAAECPLLSDSQLRQLRPFLPPYVGDEAGDGSRDRPRLTPEHRRVSIVFVDILGLTTLVDGDGPAAAVEQLQAYAAMAMRLATRHRGFVVSSDIATEGTKLIFTFGAPVAHEYAAANAARFALDLNAALRESDLTLRHKIGVNGGHVFAGEVGPAFRRQYTVMGDAVNLAARLMAAAPEGEVYASRLLLDHAGPSLCAREMEPIMVKGKAEPVAICALEEERRPGGSTPRPRRDETQGRMFGRQTELEAIRGSWGAVVDGEGRTVLIQGEPGIGKTRLLDEALRGLTKRGRLTRAACFEHLQAAPFTPWVDVLSAVMELPPGCSMRARTEAVRAFVEAHVPEYAEMASLLNPLLLVSIPQGEVVGSLDSGARRERLFELVAAILRDAAGGDAHIVVIEDIHWVDESSLALVRHLGRRGAGAGVLLLLTTRPTEEGVDLEDAPARRIELVELTEHDSLAMLREALGVGDLPAEVGDAIYVKTKGNPLFLEEVVRSLQAPGVLDRITSASSVARAAELAALEIPDRVQGLLMSRIDRLAPDARDVLKAGSVVGRSFDAALLDGIEDGLLQTISLDRAFAELIDAALVVPADEGVSGAVTFRHALVQDVAYESLPFSRRRDLHARVAAYLEATQRQLDHGLLVHHYRHAGDVEKTRVHAVRAAEASTDAYASLEAIDYLDVALDTALSRTSEGACLRSRLEELIGDSLETLGRYEEAVGSFLQARRRWGSPTVRQTADRALESIAPIDDLAARDSLLCWKIAVSVERGTSDYARALRWLAKGAASLPSPDSVLAGRLLVTQGGVLSRQGRFKEAAAVSEEAVGRTARGDDVALRAYASTLLSYAYAGLGRLDKALEFDLQSLALYELAGDLSGQALSRMNLANSYLLKGDLRTALEHNEIARVLYTRIGNVGGAVQQQVNIGGVLTQMGEAQAAVEHLEKALELRERPEVSPYAVGYALILLCEARILAGDLDRAQDDLLEGREILEGLGAQGDLLDACVIEAELRLAQKDLASAETSCRDVLRQADSLGAEVSAARAHCLLGQVQVAQGDPDAALASLDAAVTIAERIGADFERGQALAALAEAQTACTLGDDQCAATLDQAIAMFEKMGARYDLEKALELRDRLGLTVSG